MSFLRDIQPIFDGHCTVCHSGMKPAAGLDFSGGLTSGPGGRTRNVAYDTIFNKNLIARSNVNDDARITMPLAFGSHRSKLVEVLQRGACSSRAKLSQEEWLRLVTWIDLNGPYHDRFINKRQERPVYDLPADRPLESAIAAVHSDAVPGVPQTGRRDAAQLDRPAAARSQPVPHRASGQAAGGTGKCSRAVYRDTSDAGYQAVYTLVHQAVEKAWRFPRRDLESVAR